MCLPPELNINSATAERRAELLAMDEETYRAAINNFCSTTARSHELAIFGYVKSAGCGHVAVFPTCEARAPGGNTAPDAHASILEPACDLPCESIECTSDNCNVASVIVEEGPDKGVHFDRCACTNVSGCGESSAVCHPAFATLNKSLGMMSYVSARPVGVTIDRAASEAYVFVEGCKTILGIEVCSSDDDTAAVGGSVNLVGAPCPGASCQMGLEGWLQADPMSLHFDVGIIDIADVSLSSIQLRMRTNPDGVVVDSTGRGTIEPGGLFFVGSAVRGAGTAYRFEGENDRQVVVQIDFTTRQFSIPEFPVEIGGNVVTLRVHGSMDDNFLSVDAGPDQFLECSSPSGANATISASSSTTNALAYAWWVHEPFVVTNELGAESYSGNSLSVTAPLGTTTYHVGAWSYTEQGVDTDSTSITVVDTTAPSLSVALSPSVLWPPNGSLVAVTPIFGATDACDHGIAPVIHSVTVSDGAGGPGVPGVDYVISGNSLRLKATRAGNGTGRIYTVTYAVTDASGNVAQASTTVTVPHNR